MIVYEGSKRDFIKSVDNDTIAMEIQKNILEKMGRHTPINEYMSWQHSMLHMYKVMNDEEIPIDAGYCWNWPKNSRRDTNYHDIQIGDFGISWNLEDGQAFAISESSINEAGCIHTAQGLEFDYVGVIIGDDIRYEDGKVVTDFTKRASTDQSLKGIKKLFKDDPDKAKERADEIIKNTYRTLMTRGMKGCYLYCTDSGLREHIRSRLANHSDSGKEIRTM